MASGVPVLITFATLLLAAVAKDDISQSIAELKLSPTKDTSVTTEDGAAAWSEKEMQEKREALDKKFASGKKVPAKKAWEKARAWAMKESPEKEARWGIKEIAEKAAWPKKIKEKQDFRKKTRAWAKKEMAAKQAWAKKMPEEARAEKIMKETWEMDHVWKRGVAQQAAWDEKIAELKAQAGLHRISEKQWAMEGMKDFEEKEAWAIKEMPDKEAWQESYKQAEKEARTKKRPGHGSQDYAHRDHVRTHRDARANYEGYGDGYGRDNEVDTTYGGRGDDDESEEKYGHHSHGLDREHGYMHGKHHRHVDSPVETFGHSSQGHRGRGYGDKYDDAGGDDDESGYGYGHDGEADVTSGRHSHGHGHEHGYLRGKHYGYVESLVGLQQGIKGLGVPLSMVIGFMVLAASFAACMLFKGIDKLCAKRRTVRLVTADGVLLSTTSPSLLNEEERTERREGQAAASSASA